MSADSVRPVPAAEVGRWDDEADVVVVGLGCAGASAALEAAEAGARVIVLERASAGGGASAMAGGSIYLGGGTPVQEACGFTDTAEDMFRFLMAACGPDADEAKVREYCDGSLEHFDWLVAHGVPFKGSYHEAPVYEVLTDDGLQLSGGETAWPFSTVAPPVPRGHCPQVEQRSGIKLMEALIDALAATDARTCTDTTVQRLVMDDDRRVVGVVARHYGDELAIRARGGVVLTAGGFSFNDEMVRQHAPWLDDPRCFKLGTDGDDGRGIRMAQAVGAAVRHMDSAEVSCPAPPHVLMPSLLVNAAGQRFINEDVYHGRAGQAAVFRQDKDVFLVLDLATYEANPSFLKITWAAETVAELEDDMGLPEGSLQATVELYNRHAVKGEDPLFHKAPEWVRPLEPPFGAIDLRGGIYGVFTLGGLHTLPTGQVLDLDGGPVEGLYAAGRTTSGIPARGYVSGISLGDGTFFGRRAGRHAAGVGAGAGS